MAQITKRTLLFQDKNLLLMFDDEWVRTLPFSNWVRIRIGVLCAVSPNGTSNITDAGFYMGVSSGKVNPGSAYNATSFFGISVVGPAAPGSTRTLTYQAGLNTPVTGQNNPYYTSTIGQVFRKIGTAVTAVNFNTTSAILVPAGIGTQRRRIPIILDITRQAGGGGAYSVSVYGVNSTIMAYDFRQDHLLEMVDNTGTPTVYGQSLVLYATNLATVFGSDLDGQLDTISIYWSRSAYPLELYAVACSVITDMAYPATAYGGAYDTMEVYSVGSINTGGTLTGGGGWASGGYAFYGTSNAGSQFGLAGTSVRSPLDTFEAYAVGSVSTGLISQGTGWTSAATLGGTNNPATGTGYFGTTAGFPYDTLDNYAVTTYVYGSNVNAGLGWATDASFYGTANLSNGTGYVGTVDGFPYDTFDGYAVGTVVSNVTINAGSFWQSNGIIYP